MKNSYMLSMRDMPKRKKPRKADINGGANILHVNTNKK